MTAIELDEVFTGLQTWLTTHCSLDPRWRPGVSAEAIRDAQEKLGYELPADYAAFLRRHDGQEEDFGVSILSAGGRLAPLSEVVRQHEDLLDWADDQLFDDVEPTDDVRPVVFHPRRLDIGGSLWFDGDNTVLDFIPGPAGVHGQVLAAVTECDFVVVGTSLTDYLRRILRGLESGGLTFTADFPEMEQLSLANKPHPWSRCETYIRRLPPSL